MKAITRNPKQHVCHPAGKNPTPTPLIITKPLTRLQKTKKGLSAELEEKLKEINERIKRLEDQQRETASKIYWNKCMRCRDGLITGAWTARFGSQS